MKSKNVQQVEKALKNMNHPHDITILTDHARTAKEAAAALGCHVDQIAKSIVFKLKSTDAPLLVVASGRNRVNEDRVNQALQDELENVDANYVKEATGFVIGGVSPVGHTKNITILIDEDLLQYDTIWAAAGHPKAVFELTPAQLVQMTNGRVLKIN